MQKLAYDVIVIGGGVAGLTAAAEIARGGRTVAILEARGRLGGRIHTIRPKGWRSPVELGAEFIHSGNRPFWRLLRRNEIEAKRVPARHWLHEHGQLRSVNDITERIERVTREIDPDEMQGRSFAEFLRRQGAEFSSADRKLATGFVEGFQAAPKHRMSAATVAGETLDVTEQFHVPAGFDRLVEALVELTRSNLGSIFAGTIATQVEWRRGRVAVRADRRIFRARAVVISVPLGVLQARRAQEGYIAFSPPLRAKLAIAGRMGVGHANRITLRFKPAAWRALWRCAGKPIGPGFVHSRIEGIPVWWALTREPRLTGWAGGPAAMALHGKSDGEILRAALRSLGAILGTPPGRIQRALADWRAWNWTDDPFSRGAYSFAAAGQEEAAARLRAPIQDTLFFAGEATADGEEIGTVHGAFTSGRRAAKEVRAALRGRQGMNRR